MKWFAKQRLNVKFTAVLGVIVFIPIIVIYAMLFDNLKKTMITQVKNMTADTMVQIDGEIQKTVDLCNMSTQVFLNNQNLNSFLAKLKSGAEISTEELVSFYQNDIGMLERLVNSNPYLYRIRVYAQDNDFSEMMPILFHQQRMEAFPWSDSYVSGSWQYDYSDDAFGSLTSRSSGHVMSLVTDMEDYELGKIGVLEVAVDMAQIFPQLFEEDAKSWGCFLDEAGNAYTGDKESRFAEFQDEILEKAFENGGEEAFYTEAEIAGEMLILGSIPVKELSGHLVWAVSVEDELRGIDRQRNASLAIVAGIFVLLILLINLIVRALLGRLYSVLGVIRQVQEGDLEARASRGGNDEISELGAQINKMLDHIQALIDENVNRERLMKNSEIRALQNQINAHFIYNVLESIKMMAEIREDYDISDAVTSLGRLLRYSMRWVSKNVTVREEIQYIRDYLDLINLRYDYEITLSLKISEEVYRQEIPKMSLQPIVENAIYHGIEELAEDAAIYIKAIEYEEYFVLEITDSGKGMTAQQVRELEKKIAGEIEVSGGSGNGIGLKNVQDRIRISFGEEYGIGVISKEGCFTKVTVKIPFSKKGRVAG